MQTLRRNDKGNAALEFALLSPVLALLAFGPFYIGANFDRYLTVQQFSRAAANMHSRGVPFNLSSGQTLLARSALTLDIDSSGDSAVYLTTITQTSSGPKITNHFAIGNTGLRTSNYGNISSGQDGVVSPPQSTTLPPGVTLAEDRQMFVAEVYHQPEGLSFPLVKTGSYLIGATTFF